MGNVVASRVGVVNPESRDFATITAMFAGGLFDGVATPKRSEWIADGAVVLRSFASELARELVAAIEGLAAQSPWQHMVTPGGFAMSVGMISCGELGWVSDERGYRYQEFDPSTGKPWAMMPATFAQLASDAASAAGYANFAPDACLVNRYLPGAKMSLHQDRDERDLSQPIVSVSLGVSAIFRFGSLERSDRTAKLRLDNGDVVVWGGPSRLAFHGIDALAADTHRLTGACRYNLTFRRAR